MLRQKSYPGNDENKKGEHEAPLIFLHLGYAPGAGCCVGAVVGAGVASCGGWGD